MYKILYIILESSFKLVNSLNNIYSRKPNAGQTNQSVSFCIIFSIVSIMYTA